MQNFFKRFWGVPRRKKQQLQSVKNFSAEVIFMNPHHFVIAMDSFKGSVSSIEAGRIVAAAIRDVFPDSETQIFPLADGGEGTVDALVDGLSGKIVRLDVTGPLGEKIPSRFGLLPAQKTAVIEMADAAGLPSVPAEKRNPLHTTTYGLGELILAAVERGCRDFIIGIGGSATNDAGLGMLTALGVRFLHADGTPAGIYGKDLAGIAAIDLSQFASVLKDCHFSIACDVTNPLTGPNGCSAVYGPQKGATPDIVEKMDKDIAAFAALAEKALGKTDAADLPGAGAAGGLGFAFSTFLDAELKPGIDLVLDLLSIDDALQTADVLITGEGRMDEQTAMGKAPVGIAQRAKRQNPKAAAIAFCGCALPGAIAVNDHGIDAYFPILHQPGTVEEAMKPDVTERNLRQTALQTLRLLNIR